MTESSTIEYKSILLIRNKKDFHSIAKACVAFANAQGGTLVIGIEDKDTEPPSNQIVTIDEVNEVMKKIRGGCFNVGIANPSIKKAPNGAQYFEFQIYPSLNSIATTADGKVFIRANDTSIPIRSEDIFRLAAEKGAFQWEMVKNKKYTLDELNSEEIIKFVSGIRASKKVSDFIKDKSDSEILKHYLLIDGEESTNLGVLWLGFPNQRAKLAYPLTADYIVYDDQENKLRKESWHFNEHNPKDLLLEIEKIAIELKYYDELPDGLFRKQIRHYSREVVRELLVNAIAHKNYNISGHISVHVYPNRMEITSPGSLPLGITKENILHEKSRKNPHLINTLHDMELMEGEGSGYDVIYEQLTRDAKQLPVIESDFNKVTVIVYSEILDKDVLAIVEYISNNFQLTQKEVIVIGIVARHKKILSTQLSDLVQLGQEDRLRSWVKKLIENKILISQGKNKGTCYLINPELLAQAKLNIKPSLKTVQPHVLKVLIVEDLKANGKSGIKDIHSRLPDTSIDEISKTIYAMAKEKTLLPEGSKRYRIYSVAKKK